MKTKEELYELKTQCEQLMEKLRELTPEELAQVTGGNPGYFIGGGLLEGTGFTFQFSQDKSTPNFAPTIYKNGIQEFIPIIPQAGESQDGSQT